MPAGGKLPAVNRHSTFRHLVEKAVQESVDAQFYLSMSEGSSDSDAETKREQKPSCPAAKKFETCFQTGSLVSTGTDFQPNGKSDTAAAPDIIPKRLEVVKREHQGDELRDSSYNSLHLGESTDDIFQGQEHGCVDHVISLVKEQFPALGPSHLFSAHDHRAGAG
ncbi:hypothetical protein P8C59_003870 [Phyllachora maydis]|uniref:Uncharacterized protein n=1 Tax=Phyllachora maydis TaxID=1825666 RepID=A0AAD9I2U1_9PEZI|nr:hypothetical protein P8C59_003870 [Phyllachora maydis]